jgi:hypothetical protein
MNWKGHGRKRSGLVFKVLHQNFPGRIKENYEKRQYSRSPGRDFKLGLKKYESGVLTTRPLRSVGRNNMYMSLDRYTDGWIDRQICVVRCLLHFSSETASSEVINIKLI